LLQQQAPMVNTGNNATCLNINSSTCAPVAGTLMYTLTKDLLFTGTAILSLALPVPQYQVIAKGGRKIFVNVKSKTGTVPGITTVIVWLSVRVSF
jgi:hypothetical protein